jgi:hypothetical protein
MSISLSDKIVAIYPDLKGVRFNEGDIIVQNNSDGKGDFIAKWDAKGKSKPTEKQLKDVDEAAIEAEYNLTSLRIERDLLLQQSDWVVIKEREEGGSVSNFADWKKYRQELRDVTKTYKSLEDVKWPTAPSE